MLKAAGSTLHAWRLVLVVAGMFGFGFALVPIYEIVCEVTGINGKIANRASQVTTAGVDESRLITVQFITTVNGGRDWQFRAGETRVQVHPGQPATVNFYARNTEDHAIVAQAVPNVAPTSAAKYLHKTECFCFNNQPFAAGEEKEMPVRFVLDPELPADVDTVTLSYTFFDVTETAQQSAPSPPS